MRWNPAKESCQMEGCWSIRTVKLQELDRALHRKVEGDADFPFGNSKVQPKPNRTGDEIEIFFFTQSCDFKEAQKSTGFLHLFAYSSALFG